LGAAWGIVALLYATAPSALLVFFPAVICRELLGPTRWSWFLLFLGVSALAPPVVGRIIFGFASGEAYAKVLPLPWDPIVLKMSGVRLLIALYAFPSAFWAGIAIWQSASRKKDSGRVPDTRPMDQTDRVESPSAIKRHAWKLELAACAVLPIAVVWVSLNSQVKALMQLDFFAWHGQWPEALAVSANANPHSPYVACAVAQASYHTGNLLTQLPSLQAPADLLLYRNKQEGHWKESDLYYDLGYLNMALHHLTEAVEFYGERPVLLRRLALVNLALGNISTAKVYLGTLARAPFQGEWANDYLQRLQLDPNLTTDEEVSRLRRSMVHRDSVVVLTPDEELSMLLGANPRNRMAFEYLMTYYLLTRNLNGFVKNISRVNEFSNFSIPPMWDEALVLAGRMAGRQLQVPGHVISQEGVTRVENVTRAVKHAGDNAVLARFKLAPQYGHTYTFYWWFHE
jgi:tetratricopeptide (TPR) repeat protein